MRTTGIILLALVGSTVLATRSARATSPVSCTVTSVTNPVVSGIPAPGFTLSYRYLTITCSDSSQYQINISAGNSVQYCNQADPDTVKEVASMAQAAKLSGKPMTIYFLANQSCPGPGGNFLTNYITQVAF